jgi:2-hydroxychromene-2-carboxylate isomerase
VDIQFWFEFASTYSYPAAMRVERVVQARALSVSWHAFALRPIFQAQGWNDSPFNIYPAKGRYMWRDLERICEAERIALRRPSQFPRNGYLAARICAFYSGQTWLPEFVRAVYSKNFAEDREIASAEVIAECLEQAGQPAQACLAAAESEAAKQALRAHNAQATQLGLFGAPSLVVGDELFWGNDRIEQAVDWACRLRDRA